MKIVGFTFIRNGVIYDYPFLESIQSLLPICDEVVIAVGQSNDDTLLKIQSLQSSKITIAPTIWDDSIRTNGAILSQQTNLALDQVSGDWAIYLQADEILHEKDYAAIRNAMQEFQYLPEVEGFLFNFKHFYGSYQYIGDSRRWYRREIRIIRPSIGVRSWGDAQGFRIQGKKLSVKLVDADIYHYGWVKSPVNQQVKQNYFHKLWHSDEWVKSYVGTGREFDYSKGGKLKQFCEEHPSVMQDRIHKQDWEFMYDPQKLQQPLHEKMLDAIESWSGWRIGEYKNYILL